MFGRKWTQYVMSDDKERKKYIDPPNVCVSSTNLWFSNSKQLTLKLFWFMMFPSLGWSLKCLLKPVYVIFCKNLLIILWQFGDRIIFICIYSISINWLCENLSVDVIMKFNRVVFKWFVVRGTLSCETNELYHWM